MLLGATALKRAMMDERANNRFSGLVMALAKPLQCPVALSERPESLGDHLASARAAIVADERSAVISGAISCGVSSVRVQHVVISLASIARRLAECHCAIMIVIAQWCVCVCWLVAPQRPKREI